LQYPSIRECKAGSVKSIYAWRSFGSPAFSMLCFSMYVLKICFFSLVVYPVTSILSNLSKRGGNMVSS